MPSPKPSQPPPDRAFADHCCELLASAGPCTARRMFGGWGMSTGGLNMALIIRDVLYLKADADTIAQFEAAGGRPFTYATRGTTHQLNYYTVPDDAMESPPAMAPWARLALASALKSASKARQVHVKRSSLATNKVAKAARKPAARPPRKG